MQKIHFTLFVQAYYVDSNWGFGCPSGGIRNMGKLCHKHGIPVTWLLSPKSARCEQEMLTEFHEKYGDEAAMMVRFPLVDEMTHGDERQQARNLSVEECRALVRDQKARIEQVLPWADIKVAGQGIRTPNLLTAVKEEGLIGMFGHCYCQIGTDSITDFGMPWGSFPMRLGSAHLPAHEGEEGPVTFEWTMRDLNRSIHTVRPELWSTDPNDVERGGVCTDTNVEYWKELFMQYERALPLNDQGLWFQFHQEAHEQTWGEVCRPFTEDRVIFCTKMMDLFFEWLTKRDTVEFMTATVAAEKYKTAHPKGTLPMYVPYAWTPVPEEMQFWSQLDVKNGYAGNVHKCGHLPDEALYDYLMAVNQGDPVKAMKTPPWMDSFFFFDADCQLVFDIGKSEPFVLFNYLNYVPDPEMVEDMGDEIGGGAIGYFIEPNIPPVKVNFNSESMEPGHLTISTTNSLDKELPYGVFLWSQDYPKIIDYFTQNPGLLSKWQSKISPDQGVFIKIILKPGENSVLF